MRTSAGYRRHARRERHRTPAFQSADDGPKGLPARRPIVARTGALVPRRKSDAGVGGTFKGEPAGRRARLTSAREPPTTCRHRETILGRRQPRPGWSGDSPHASAKADAYTC
ncbi:hypothetical protein TBR22_A09300 [Luteitalea sp. TBR-22]|nr:hypothetical protein TBR22_A09300 [Luteitalea sp. TBR-22]